MKSYKPITPSRRHMTVSDFKNLSKGGPFKPLLKRLKKNSGRNNQGRITMRHQGGGAKALYRKIDFKQKKLDIWGRVEKIEYDPYRSAFIMLVVYADGERRYLVAPEGIAPGYKIITSSQAPLEVGMRTTLKRIPIGTFVHNIEFEPERGGALVRGAGAAAEVLGNENKWTHLKLPSGELRKIPWNSFCTIGRVSNSEHNLTVIGKAGRARMMGVRPTVRGSAMNPVDHPYGGGEGRALRGTRRPKTLWGKTTGGRKTRKKKKLSNKLIIKKRTK